MSSSPIIVHIVYVHGFQGDHTTFQSFPTDLHKALLPQLPPHITLRSILYPTYKSRRPIAVATQNFLHWLDSLPYGPVIICGHSMGGLLVAEAATSSTHSAARRVIALLAFDVPFLGMHPHVVISGIASLLPNKKGDSNEHGSERDKQQGGGLKSEREMNDKQHVNVPADGASETSLAMESSTSLSHSVSPSPHSPASSSIGPPPLPPRPASHTQTPRSPLRSPSPTPAIISRALGFIDSHSNDPLVRFISKHHADPLGAAKRWVVESFEFGVCMFDPKGLRDRYATLQRWHRPWVAFWTETMPGAERSQLAVEAADVLVEEEVSANAQEEGVKKEREETASLGRLLEPTMSHTTTDSQDNSASPSPPPSPSPSPSPPSHPEPASLPEYGPITKSAHKVAEKDAKNAAKQQEKELKAREKAAKALQKQQDKELKALRKTAQTNSAHHFVVRPFKAPSSPVHRWEQVKIRGAKDEVEAHCGLFLRDVNWEYEAFVERVGGVVWGWIDDLDEKSISM